MKLQASISWKSWNKNSLASAVGLAVALSSSATVFAEQPDGVPPNDPTIVDVHLFLN
jgi:hypothetical protein